MLRCNIYAMEVDQGRNYYNCKGFGHIAKYCRDWEFVGKKRRVEYGDNCNIDNLKEEKNIVVLD